MLALLVFAGWAVVALVAGLFLAIAMGRDGLASRPEHKREISAV